MRPARRSDAGLAEIQDRYQHLLTPGAGAAPAVPGLEVEAGAGLAVHIGAAVAGAVGRELAAHRVEEAHRRRKVAQAVFPFQITPTLLTGSGTVDAPWALGPPTGWAWDIGVLVAASFSAGTVTVYRDGVADANQRFTFTSAGVWVVPSGKLIVQAGQRLVMVAAGITGDVTLSGEATAVRNDYLGAYLL